mmetsp:Transcript_94060/g.265640  ORF Transcript_94060/g.265640 Transcript_94060/m.265640 type:complete len:207 (+) Transcript_94060:804-1424(+)
MRQVIRHFVNEQKEARVHIRLEPPQRQVILAGSEGTLELRGDDVQREHPEHRQKRDKRTSDLVLNECRYQNRRGDGVHHQQGGDELREGKRKHRVGDFLGVQQIYKTPRQRLVNAGHNGRRHLDDAIVERLRNEHLYHVQQHLDSVELEVPSALLEETQRRVVEAHNVDNVEGLPGLALDLLQGAAVAQTHQSYQSVPEFHNVVVL